MHHFFRHAVDSQLTASPAYFELLLQQFQADKSSGFIAVQAEPERQLVALFIHGVRTLLLELDAAGDQAVVLSMLDREWSTPEAPIRTLVAPSLAARAIGDALLWGPPERQPLEAFDFENYLNECRAQESCGLLYTCTPTSDGFLTLWEGEVYNAETVFDNPRGFVETSPLSKRAMEIPFEEWEVAYYPCRPEIVSGQLFGLRLALMRWMNDALGHYHSLVGQNLVLNINHQVNALARGHLLDIRTVGTTLIDRQFFPNQAQMTAAYWLLVPSLLHYMRQVIGAGLVHRIAYGALNRLSPRQAEAMEEAGFGSNSDLWK